MAIIDMNIFWTEWDVACGNQSANNRYDCFYGLTFNDGFVCANATDFFNHVGYSRYDFFRSYDDIDSEYDFYKNTSDPNIYDFKTFYEIAPSYFPSNCGAITPFVIAFKGDSSPYKSFDGINWTQITTDTLTSYDASSNCNVSNGQYVWIGGASNIIRYDKINDLWENFTPSIVFRDLAWNEDAQELIGITRDTTTNNVHISTDLGETWTSYSATGGIQIDCIGYSQGYLLYYGSQKFAGTKRIVTSPDGINWTSIVTSSGGAATTDSRYLDSVDIGGDIWFIPARPSSGGRWFLKTNDFVTWNQYENTTINSDWRNAASDPNNDAVVLMGEVNRVSTWKPLPGIQASNAPTTYQYTDSCFFTSGNVFIAVTRTAALADTNRKILYSNAEGNNWLKVDGTSGTFSNVFTVE